MRLINIIVLFGIFQQYCALTMPDMFDDWVRYFNIKFGSDMHREHVFVNWVENHKYIDTINNRNLTYKLGHNQFSGLNTEEFSQFINRWFPRCASTPNIRISNNAILTLPTSVDWVNAGAVTQVKDQGQCGSCWSFSTTGALEGAYAIKYGTLVSFSEQQLVDCDNFIDGGKDRGCNGGLMDNAFEWISKNDGLCTESDYPYVSGNTMSSGKCMKSCSIVSGSDIQKHVDVTPRSDTALMEALAKQPVSIAIEADQKDFQLYKSGVFTGSCGTNIDHGVLAVGYGSINGVDYYKVKNSWSTTWGDNGYILLGRGDYNNGYGQCGILSQPSYPVL